MPDKNEKARILICDDEVIIAADLASRLKNLGYTICAQATSGERALELVEEHQPDLVMMDIVLQGEMDGIDAAAVIKDKWGIPVVFLTAYADTDRLERAKLTYPFGYLLKPFHDRDLKVTTEMALYVSKVDEERRKVEKSLEEANTDLRLAQKIANIGNWSLDPEVGTPEWSEHVYEIYERSPDDGPPSLEDYKTIYSAEHLDTFWNAIQAAINDGKPYDIKLLLNLPSGKSKWVHAICEPSPIKGPKGHVLKGTIQDITDRIKTEEALKASEVNLARAQRLAQIGSWNWMLGDIKAWWSDELYEIYGRDKEQGAPSEDEHMSNIHPDDRGKLTLAIEDSKKTGRYECEYRIIRYDDGTVRYISALGEVDYNSAGEPARHFGVAQDITDRKQAEKSLRESEERFRNLLQYTHSGIGFYKLDGTIIHYNHIAANLMSGRTSDFVGKSIFDLFPPDDAKTYYQRIVSASQSDKSIVYEDFITDLPSGKKYWFESHYSKVLDDNEQVIGVQIISNDITARKQIEEELTRQKRALQSILDGIPDIIGQQLPDYTIIQYNKAAYDLLCLTPEEVIGKKCYELIGRSVPCSECASIDAIKSGQIQQMEKYLPELNRWFRINAIPIFDVNQQVETIVEQLTDITDRKLSEETLRKNEEKYRNLFDNMMQEIHLWKLVRDEHGSIKTWKLVDANPTALKAWGKTISEVIDKTPDEIFNVNATAQFMPIVNKIFTEGEPHTWEEYFSVTDQILYMTSGPFGEYFFSTGIDITERKKAEEELNQALLKLRQAVKAGNVGLWDWDLLDNRVHYSAEWKQQIGYEDHEISDDFEEWKSRVHPEDLESTMRRVNQSIQTVNHNHNVEYRFCHKDGSYLWIMAQASFVLNDEGKPIRMLGSHIDITDRKLLEKELMERNEMLRKAEEMAKLGSFKWDIASDTWTFSDKWLNIHGCQSAPVSSEELLPIAHPDDKPIIEKELNEAIQGLKPYNLVHRIIRQNNGAIRWCKAYGEIKFDDSGNAVSMYGIGQDITDLKEIENELKSSLKEKETLLLEIHHRVRNNMQVIISLMKLQSDKLDDEKFNKPFLETQNRIYAMSAVHETLHQSENLSSVDLSEYLTKLSETTFQTYRTDGGNIQLSTEIKTIPVDLEKSYPIGLVINELLSNSLKYAFPAGREGEISISGVLEDNTAKLVVSDTGVGIPQDFDWRNTDSLGLQIVRSLVEDQLRGTIDLDRTNGTKWTITFPV